MNHRKLAVAILFSTLNLTAQQEATPAKPTPQNAPPAKTQTAPAPPNVAAEQPAPDLQAMIKESEQVVFEHHKLGLFWWVPPDYWTAALLQQGYKSEQSLKIYEPFKRYNVFVIAVGDMHATDISWRDEGDIRKYILLRDQRGNAYKPIDEVPDDVRTLIDVLKPIFKNMMGNFGGGLQFILFPLKDEAGNVLADPHKSSELRLEVTALIGPSAAYTWRFPMTSLTPPKYCPVGKERVEANWKYCPWHGNKLMDDVAAAHTAVSASR